MFRIVVITVITLMEVVPVEAAPVLVFNPQVREATAVVEFAPHDAALEGVAADRVVLTMAGRVVPSQAEDSDLDGQITDRDTVYAAVTVKPGNNWLEATAGDPKTPGRLISVKAGDDRLQAGWMELDARNGRPLAITLADGQRITPDLQLRTGLGEWAELNGRVHVSDLPLRSRVDFITEGDKPLKFTVLVHPHGRCDVITVYPNGSGEWRNNRRRAAAPFVSQTGMFAFERTDDSTHHWLTASGEWIPSDHPHPRYRVPVFFAGIGYPQHRSGVGVFQLDTDPNVSQTPMGIWARPAPDSDHWQVEAVMDRTTTNGYARFAFVRYAPLDDAGQAPPVIEDLYYEPQVYVGQKLQNMLAGRAVALDRIGVITTFKSATPITEARQLIANGDVRQIADVFESYRDDHADWRSEMNDRIGSVEPTGAIAAVLDEAETLLAAQKLDRQRPLRFVSKASGAPDRYIDRLVRADERLAEADAATMRALKLRDAPVADKIAAQVTSSSDGESFRAGFGTCAGMHRELFDLKWGYNVFEPMIQVGIRNFHFQAIRWITHDSGDGELRDLDNYDRLFEQFDRAGATAVPQLQMWGWWGLPRWMKSNYKDWFVTYETERAGVDGKVVKETDRRLAWIAPDLYGQESDWQRDFNVFCQKTVKQLNRHDSVIGWAVMNEFGASAESAFANPNNPFVVKEWRNYLKQQYETIDELNAAWRSDYASFDDVPTDEPKRNSQPERLRIDLDGTWRFAVDPDQIGRKQAWYAADFDDGGWADIKVPG